MREKVCYIPVEILFNFMKDVFMGSGATEENAKTCADVLIESDIKGIESHGIGRLKMYFDKIKLGQINPKAKHEIIRESPTTALIDGNHALGMVTAKYSMQLAINKAKDYGMGSVAVRNSSHFGIDGYYAMMAVNAGMVGMSFTNARPAIAPTFGAQPMLGTNPIAFGAPSDEEFPFLYDAATSICQRGKIEVASREGKNVPEGWVINDIGQSTNDPDLILEDLVKGRAALLPLGGSGELLAGYKGYGLATIVEILCASLQSGSFLYGLSGIGESGKPAPNRIGHFFMAINIDNFIPISEFKSTTGQILRDLRAARKAPGYENIFTAGEKEYLNEKAIRKNGVPIVPTLQDEMKIMKKELQLSQYDFPF